MKKTIGYIANFKTKTKNEHNSIVVNFVEVISDNKNDCLKFKNKKDFTIIEIHKGDSSNISTSIDTIDISKEEILPVWEQRAFSIENIGISKDFYFTFKKLGNWRFYNFQKINFEEVTIQFLKSMFPDLSISTIKSNINTITDFEVSIYEKELTVI